LFITKQNAITFESGSSHSLEASIEYSLKNKEDILSKAQSGKIDVSMRFNWDKIADQYIEIFKK